MYIFKIKFTRLNFEYYLSLFLTYFLEEGSYYNNSFYKMSVYMFSRLAIISTGHFIISANLTLRIKFIYRIRFYVDESRLLAENIIQKLKYIYIVMFMKQK